MALVKKSGKNRSMSFTKAWSMFGLWFVAMCLYYFILRVYQLHTSENLSLSSNNDIKTNLRDGRNIESKPHKNIAILLQQSPVDINNQLTRLTAIDQTSWSKWTIGSAIRPSRTQIYASLPQLSDPNLIISNRPYYHHINPLQMIYPLNYTINPFYHLVRGMFTLLVVNSDLQWIVLANDHSFFVVPNLECFLSKYNSNIPIYTGNKLQRGVYKNGYALYFASGGAGIVLSHVSVKLFLISLVISNSDILHTIQVLMKSQSTVIPELESIPNDCQYSKRNRAQSHIIIDTNKNIWCVLRIIEYWKTSKETQLTYDLSPILQIRLIKSNTSPSSITIDILINPDIKNKNKVLNIYSKNSNEELIQSQYEKLTIPSQVIRDTCNPDSDWQLLNPALVLAYCLQRAYQTPFIDSTKHIQSIESSLVPILNDIYPKTLLSNQSIVFERFNCFGVVRSLFGDVDDWYFPAKRPYIPFDRSRPHTKLPIEYLPILMDQYLISFHYVSQKESELLYKIISREIIVKNSEELERIWPQPGTPDVGHYARARFHDQQEINRLYVFLTQYIQLHETQCIVE